MECPRHRVIVFDFYFWFGFFGKIPKPAEYDDDDDDDEWYGEGEEEDGEGDEDWDEAPYDSDYVSSQRGTGRAIGKRRRTEEDDDVHDARVPAGRRSLTEDLLEKLGLPKEDVPTYTEFIQFSLERGFFIRNADRLHDRTGLLIEPLVWAALVQPTALNIGYGTDFIMRGIAAEYRRLPRDAYEAQARLSARAISAGITLMRRVCQQVTEALRVAERKNPQGSTRAWFREVDAHIQTARAARDVLQLHGGERLDQLIAAHHAGREGLEAVAPAAEGHAPTRQEKLRRLAQVIRQREARREDDRRLQAVAFSARQDSSRRTRKPQQQQQQQQQRQGRRQGRGGRKSKRDQGQWRGGAQGRRRDADDNSRGRPSQQGNGSRPRTASPNRGPSSSVPPR
jgi:hypothetical protein